MFSLQSISLVWIGPVALALLLLAAEAGHRLGKRALLHKGSSMSLMTTTVLGLLTLIIGFTFSMGLTRHEIRREALVAEANAIGTAALRARLLPQPINAESLQLLREYLQTRLDLIDHTPTAAEIQAAVDHSSAVQEKLWQAAKTLTAKDSAMVPGGLYIQSLNEMIDAQETRLTAVNSRLPDFVIIGLYILTAVASTFTGYSASIEAPRSPVRLPLYIMTMSLWAVIFLIQDIDRPGRGVFQISQQPLLDTAASMASFKD